MLQLPRRQSTADPLRSQRHDDTSTRRVRTLSSVCRALSPSASFENTRIHLELQSCDFRRASTRGHSQRCNDFRRTPSPETNDSHTPENYRTCVLLAWRNRMLSASSLCHFQNITPSTPTGANRQTIAANTTSSRRKRLSRLSIIRITWHETRAGTPQKLWRTPSERVKRNRVKNRQDQGLETMSFAKECARKRETFGVEPASNLLCFCAVESVPQVSRCHSFAASQGRAFPAQCLRPCGPGRLRDWHVR